MAEPPRLRQLGLQDAPGGIVIDYGGAGFSEGRGAIYNWNIVKKCVTGDEAAGMPEALKCIKVSALLRLPRWFLRTISQLSEKLGPVRYFTSLFMNESLLELLESGEPLHHDCLREGSYMKAMRAIAKGHARINSTHNQEHDQLVTKEKLRAFFERHPRVSDVVDHEYFCTAGRTVLVTKFGKSMAESLATAAQLCVKTRFLLQLKGFILLRLRQHAAFEESPETTLKSIGGRMLLNLLDNGDAPVAQNVQLRDAVVEIHEEIRTGLGGLYTAAEGLHFPQSDYRHAFPLIKKLLHSGLKFIALPFQRKMSLAFATAREELEHMYSVLEEDPDLLDENTINEVRAFLEANHDEDLAEIVNDLGAALAGVPGMLGVAENLMEEQLNAAIDDVSARQAARAALQELPRSTLKSKKPFSLLPVASMSCPPLNISRINASWICGVAGRRPQILLSNDQWWWKSVLRVDGPEFMKIKSRRGKRQKYRRLASVVTSEQEWLARLNDPHCMRTPWIIDGFTCDGRSINIRLITSVKGKGHVDPRSANMRTRLPGLWASYRPGYRRCPSLDLSMLPEDGSAGLYKAIFNAAHAIQSGSKRRRVQIRRPLIICVVDPGQINILSYATVCISADAVVTIDSGFVTEEAYHAGMPHARRLQAYEEERRRAPHGNPDYARAIANLRLQTKKTADLHRFIAFVEVAIAHCGAIFAESHSFTKKELLMRCHQERRQTIDRIVREICFKRPAVLAYAAANNLPSSHVSLVFFGNGATRAARGRRPAPTKRFARAFSRIVPTIVVDEFRTSSRCPVCKEASPHRLFSMRIDDDAPGPMPEEGNHGHSFVTSHTRDRRWEFCMVCEAMYRHDKVSLLNLLEIALAMLNGAPRPAYLSRGDEEAAVHAAIVA